MSVHGTVLYPLPNINSFPLRVSFEISKASPLGNSTLTLLLRSVTVESVSVICVPLAWPHDAVKLTRETRIDIKQLFIIIYEFTGIIW